MTDEGRELEDFTRMVIEGAKLLMHMAHDIVVDIRYQQLLKNNGPVDALCFRQEGESISPTVHLTNFFSRYKAGEDIDSIIKDITETAYRGMQKDIKMPDISQEEAKRCIRLDLVNHDNNRQMLDGVPFFTIGEEGPGQLAAFPRWYISDQASFVVTDEMCGRIGLVPEEVLKIGQNNTQSMDYKLRDIGDVLHEMFTDMGRATEELDKAIDMEPPDLLVLTSPDCCHGAACMLNTAALDEAKTRLKSETIYIIPSSIHECLICNDKITPDVLMPMIMDINRTELDRQDILSDIPLKYDGHGLSLAIIPTIEQEQEMSKSVSRRMEMSMM